MKKKLLLFIICISTYVTKQQLLAQEGITYTSEVTKELSPLIQKDVKLYKNSILYNKVIPLANLSEFNKMANPQTNTDHFKRAWQELYNSRITKTDKHIPVKELEEICNYYQTNDVVQIGLINVDFTQLKENIIADIQDEKVSISLLSERNSHTNQGKVAIENPYENKHVFLACPLANTAILTASNTVVIFEIGQLGLDMSHLKIKSLSVNFNGQVISLFENSNLVKSKFALHFSNSGTKTIQFAVEFTNGKRLSHEAKFPVIIKSLAKKGNTSLKIRATKPFRGYDEPMDCNGDCFGEGEYQIFLSKKNSKLTKPVIILDGFDPGDLRKIDNGKDGIVSLINSNGEESNMEKFDDNGFDVVILNFPKRSIDTKQIKYWHPFSENYNYLTVTNQRDGGSDYIERNANVLKALIVKLNNELKQNNSSEKLKIIGPSMGGLISRIALTEMEKVNQKHNVDVWVSFDSPHLGANIPVGLQYFFNFLELDQVDALKTPAAKQMLVTQVVDETYEIRNIFKNKLSQLGFPNTTRNLALINGSINGKRVGTPKDKMLHADVRALNTPLGSVFRYQINTFSSHDGGRHKIFERYKRTLFSKKRHSAYLNDNSGSGSIDNSPGGYFDMKHEFESALGIRLPLINWNAGDAVNKLLDVRDKPAKFGIRVLVPFILTTIHSSVYLNLYQDKPSFIPSKSALAYQGFNKLLHEDLSNRNLVCSNETPFDSYYAPINNEEHITLNSDNMNWILQELKGIKKPAFKGVPVLNISKLSNVFSGDSDIEHHDAHIIAYNKISPNANVNYQSATQVILKPGFHAKRGASFKTSISFCEGFYQKNSNKVNRGKEFFANGKIDHNLDENSFQNTKFGKMFVDEEQDLLLYPNPSKGIVNIISVNQEITSYKISNTLGKVIQSKYDLNKNNIKIDLEKHSSGIYFITLQFKNKKNQTKKIIYNK